MPQTVAEEGFPAIKPSIVLGQIAIIRCTVEPELALGGGVA